MKNKRILVCGLAAMLMAVGFVAARAQQDGKPAATVVAVVKLQQLVDQCNQQAAFQSATAAAVQQLKEENERRRAELAKLAADIDPLLPGGEPWQKMRTQIQEKQIALEVWVRMIEQNTQLDRARHFAQIYQAATDATAQIAKAQGYDVVLQGGDLPDLMKLEAQQLQTVVQTRKVIYASERVDITQAVLARMNAEYDNRQ